MTPRHVGYVLKKYPRLSETFVLTEILGVEAAGVDVSVFSLRLPDEGRFHAQLASVRADVTYLQTSGSSAALTAFRTVAGLGAQGRLERVLSFVDRFPPERQASLLLQGVELARQVGERDIDHLHAHFMTVAAHTSYIAHILTGVPFSVTSHAKDVYRTEVSPQVFREVASAAKAVVTVCDANERFMNERLLGGVPAEVVRIYNGIDTTALPPPASRRTDGLVLGVGRLVEKKGFDVLVEACALLQERAVPFHCVVLGDGEERDALVELAAARGVGDRVRFHGARPHHEILEWMQRASVFALPCVTGADGNRDALPTVLIEALALGLAAVTTPVGGVPEIVEDGLEGLIVAERDPVTLADALERLLAEPDTRHRMSEAGVRKVQERFDRRRTLPQLIRVFGGSGAPAEGAA